MIEARVGVVSRDRGIVKPRASLYICEFEHKFRVLMDVTTTLRV